MSICSNDEGLRLKNKKKYLFFTLSRSLTENICYDPNLAKDSIHFPYKSTNEKIENNHSPMAKQVSKEQKLERLMSLFTPNEVYNLKELEKLAGKIGLRSQLIKDLVTELVNEHKIQSDKIGISLYYWKFPVTNDIELVKLEQEDQKIKNQLETLISKKKSLKQSRSVENRDDLIKEFVNLSEQKSKLNVSFNYSDYKSLLEQSNSLIRTINEITDDIFILQGYVSDQFGMSRNDFNTAFGIKDDMDVIE